MKQRLRIPNSIEDFRELRERKFEYIDKSQMISEFLDRDGHKVLLLPRPRRFGKTLNLTMLKWFFEKREENLWHLFEDLRIGRAGPEYKAHFQQYPIIHLSFKGTKADTFEDCQDKIRRVIRSSYEAHSHVLQGKLSRAKQRDFEAIVDGTASEGLYQWSLLNLTEYLHEAYGKRPIVLIDEYDAAIHAGYAHDYYSQAVGFFRSFFEAGLKDNPHLERAIMTGILRVAKESIFSGLNNPGVFSLLGMGFNTCFGFTTEEVAELLDKAGLGGSMSEVRAYYNGYEFGGVEIYNPWSILEFLASDTSELVGYWANTSENQLVKRLLHRHAFVIERDLRVLLEGGSIAKKLNDNIVFPELEQNAESIWNILVFSGYLKASRTAPPVRGQPPLPYQLSIPNVEVAEIYRSTFQTWMNQGLAPAGSSTSDLTSALLDGDVLRLQTHLETFCAYVLSYHDVAGPDPERFYHGLVLGLLGTLEPDYEVRSNRESGAGRPDVWIKPRQPGKAGAVLELKAAGKYAGRTMKQALALGRKQLAAHDYAAELRAAGVETIHQWIIAFDGKRVHVELEKAATQKKARARRVKKAGRKKNL